MPTHRTLDRVCIVCHTDLEITVTPDGIEGGVFFGTIAADTAAEYSATGPPANRTDDGLEIWECEPCYLEVDG